MASADEPEQRPADRVDHHEGLMREECRGQEHLLEIGDQIIALGAKVIAQADPASPVRNRLPPLDVSRKKQDQKDHSGP